MAEPRAVVEKCCNYESLERNLYTPTSEQTGDLLTNIVNREKWGWGDTPKKYVEWFAGLWKEGDPTAWGEHVFTPDAVMLDPVGRTVGAKYAAADFELLFRYFPGLRAEVLSWAANESEILINWRFRITGEWFCPVVDKFCFREGRVSFRQAYFDPLMLLAYLSRQSGAAPFIDYYQRRFARAIGGAGMLFLPGLLWSLFLGFFRWAPRPLPPPKGLTAKRVDGRVRLEWEPVKGARAYRVRRSDAGGRFLWPTERVEHPWFVDDEAVEGETYRYDVSSIDSVPAPARRLESVRPPVEKPVPPTPPRWQSALVTTHRSYVRRGEW